MDIDLEIAGGDMQAKFDRRLLHRRSPTLIKNATEAIAAGRRASWVAGDSAFGRPGRQ